MEHPADYRWSGYRSNAQGETNALITSHEVHAALGAELKGWQVAYRELFRHELDPGMVDEFRRATNGNYALGKTQFAEQIAAALERRVTPGVSGRPRKLIEGEAEDGE